MSEEGEVKIEVAREDEEKEKTSPSKKRSLDDRKGDDKEQKEDEDEKPAVVKVQIISNGAGGTIFALRRARNDEKNDHEEAERISDSVNQIIMHTMSQELFAFFDRELSKFDKESPRNGAKGAAILHKIQKLLLDTNQNMVTVFNIAFGSNAELKDALLRICRECTLATYARTSHSVAQAKAAYDAFAAEPALEFPGDCLGPVPKIFRLAKLIWLNTVGHVLAQHDAQTRD